MFMVRTWQPWFGIICKKSYTTQLFKDCIIWAQPTCLWWMELTGSANKDEYRQCYRLCSWIVILFYFTELQFFFVGKCHMKFLWLTNSLFNPIFKLWNPHLLVGIIYFSYFVQHSLVNRLLNNSKSTWIFVDSLFWGCG